jgi:hypothetical protein
MDTNYVIGKNHFQLKDKHLYYKNKTKMSSTNLELLIETESSQVFPMVAHYLNNELKPTTIKEDEKSHFIMKIDMVNNCFEVPRTMDILSAIEITGAFIEPALLSTTRATRLSEIYRRIQSIDIEMGGEIITCVYLTNEICEISTNQHFFTIHIAMNKIFYNYDYIPVIALRYHAIRIHVHEFLESSPYDCYVLGAVLDTNIRPNFLRDAMSLLYKDFYKYDGKITGNAMKVIYEYGKGMSATNMISSLYFRFDANMRSRLKNIELKTGNGRTITMIPLSQIQFISDYEFVIDKFYYKTFLYNTVVIEFVLRQPFYDTSFSLITTNYNVLIIGNGFSGKAFNNLRRSVCGAEIDGFDEMSDELYEEKVVPKGDGVCGITHDEFEDGDVRVICGECFSSFQREAIEMWFNSKNKRQCPCCREEDGAWWKR